MSETWLKLFRENINDENKKEFYTRLHFEFFLLIITTIFILFYIFSQETYFSLIIFLTFYWFIITIVNGFNGIIDKSIFYIAYPKSNSITEFKNIAIIMILIYLLPFFIYSIINEKFPGFIFLLSFFGGIIFIICITVSILRIIEFFE